MANNCALCPSSVGNRDTNEDLPTLDKARELFHKPCSNCSAKLRDDRTCDQCRHLRLQHLVQCIRPENLAECQFAVKRALIEVDFVTACPLCSLIRHAILVGTREQDLAELRDKDISIRLYLGRLEACGGSIQAEVVIYHRFEERGRSIISFKWCRVHLQVIPDGKYQSMAFSSQLTVSQAAQGCERTEVKAFVNWPYLREKVKACQEGHVRCSSGGGRRLPSRFRVIDVVERRLVESTEHQYIALSYVWGAKAGSHLLETKAQTIESMRKAGGLSKLGMPATIEDAMKVCMELGERYLWVDRLCIIQDDQEDRPTQMAAMAGIFFFAQLVLIAEHGDSMQYGLPGVGHPREVVQRHEDFDGLRLTNVVDDVPHDPRRVWQTRGWTYQEAVLSLRRLYLCRRRAYYECEEATYHEDRFDLTQIRKRGTPLSLKLMIPEETSQFESYTRHILQYSDRRLTYISDIYDAIAGIMNSLYAGEGSIEYGLPWRDFDRALLWIAVKGVLELSEADVSDGQACDTTLPSWSWSSAMALSRAVMYHNLPLYGALVTWFVWNGDELNGGFQTISSRRDPRTDDNRQIHMALACTHGCVEGITMDLDSEMHPFSIIVKRFDLQWRGLSSADNSRIPHPLGLDSMDQTHDNSKLDRGKRGLLFTRWQRAFLRLKPDPNQNAAIINPKGETIGQLRGYVLPSHEHFFSNVWSLDALFEFGAISLCGQRISPYRIEDHVKRIVDAEGSLSDMIPVVYVMMIRRENNVACRLTIGTIFLVDWIKLEREWVDLVLR